MADDDPAFISRYTLTDAEVAAIEGLLTGVLRGHDAMSVEEILLQVRHIAHRGLPSGVLAALEHLRLLEIPPVLVISGLPIDDATIGPTPLHWSSTGDAASREELYLVLLGSVLGDLVAWESLQAGRLVHNVVPIPSEEHEQSGHGSLAQLEWHTEDSFHPFRCDYLGLLALRNDDQVATTLSSVQGTHLGAAEVEVLAQRRFLIRPDDEHVRQFVDVGSRSRDPDHAWSDPEPVSVLFGDRRHPYLRVDPTFMAAVPGDDEAASALDTLVRQLDDSLHGLVLDAGSVCLIDNYRMVHGRRSFAARYDGTDRWLKKILVTRDLRKSRAARQAPNARIMSFSLPGGGSPTADPSEVACV